MGYYTAIEGTLTLRKEANKKQAYEETKQEIDDSTLEEEDGVVYFYENWKIYHAQTNFKTLTKYWNGKLKCNGEDIEDISVITLKDGKLTVTTLKTVEDKQITPQQIYGWKEDDSK